VAPWFSRGLLEFSSFLAVSHEYFSCGTRSMHACRYAEHYLVAWILALGTLEIFAVRPTWSEEAPLRLGREAERHDSFVGVTPEVQAGKKSHKTVFVVLPRYGPEDGLVRPYSSCSVTDKVFACSPCLSSRLH
jgi:hypothetical protein